MPPRQHHGDPPIEETTLPLSYQGRVHYETIRTGYKAFPINSRNHTESEMNNQLPEVVHENPNNYPYQYRHWRELLLAENTVDVDAGEAHVFDFSKESLEEFQEQQEVWADARKRLAGVTPVKPDEAEDIDIREDDVDDASPIPHWTNEDSADWTNGSLDASGNTDIATLPVARGNAYDEDSDDGDEEWEDCEQDSDDEEEDWAACEEDLQTNNAAGVRDGTDIIDRATTPTTTEDNATISEAQAEIFALWESQSAHTRSSDLLKTDSDSFWTRVEKEERERIWTNKPKTSNISQATWDKLASYWPVATRAGLPTNAVFEDCISGWFMQSENHSQCTIDNRNYRSQSRDLLGLVERLVMSTEMAEDMSLAQDIDQNSFKGDASQKALTILEKPEFISIYLSPWQSALKKAHQWRVFVPPVPAGAMLPEPFRISAISQKGSDIAYMAGKSKEELMARRQEAVHQIISVCQPKIEAYLHANEGLDTVRRQLRRYGFVYDAVEIMEGGRFTVRIVQIKPFGGMSSTKSALFHWAGDPDELYSISDHATTAGDVYVRTLEDLPEGI